MNAYSRSYLDHFGNEFIFLSLGGEGGQQGREAERYLEVNTENTSSAKVRVQLLLFVQALPGQVIPNSLSAS